MKLIFSGLLICMMLLGGTSCHSQKASVKTENKAMLKLTGTVKEIQNGKDGYTAKIVTDDGNAYFATISHSNLRNPKQYRTLQPGEKVTVRGHTWRMEEEIHLTVRELRK